MLVAVTVLPVPTFASVKVLGPAAEQVTTSLLMTPLRVQPLIAAVLLPSYVLFEAVTDAVTVFGFTVRPELPLAGAVWLLSPGQAALMLCTLAWVGVTVTLHVAVPNTPATKVHVVLEKLSLLSLLKVTMPVGVIFVPVSVSVTVAVAVVLPP